MNRINLIGRITRDPELKNSSNGNTQYVAFTLSVNRPFGANNNDKADFINCVLFNKSAETLARYTKKGALLVVEGRLQLNEYQAQDGSRRTTHTVMCDNFYFLESRNPSRSNESNNSFNQDFQPVNNYGGNSYNNQKNYNNQNNYNNQKPNNDPFSNIQNQIDITDDDLPF